MNKPQEKSKPTDPEETDTKTEVEGRKAVSDTTSVPQDRATPNTTVPQDNN
jgi:hypothetical protein